MPTISSTSYPVFLQVLSKLIASSLAIAQKSFGKGVMLVRLQQVAAHEADLHSFSGVSGVPIARTPYISSD